jgi:hypothetical protein
MKKLEQITIYFEVWAKKYPITITDTNDNEVVYINCDVAELNQRYARADLPYLFKDLPDMIKDVQNEKRESNLLIRLSWREKLKIEELAKEGWFKNLSSYVRVKLLQTS